jgi:hypothetical protein
MVVSCKCRLVDCYYKSSNGSKHPSPDCSEKPTVKKDRFSWIKRATKGSSFWDLENQLFERGLVAEGWKELLGNKILIETNCFYGRNFCDDVRGN